MDSLVDYIVSLHFLKWQCSMHTGSLLLEELVQTQPTSPISKIRAEQTRMNWTAHQIIETDMPAGRKERPAKGQRLLGVLM